jgi:hypothetical protein
MANPLESANALGPDKFRIHPESRIPLVSGSSRRKKFSGGILLRYQKLKTRPVDFWAVAAKIRYNFWLTASRWFCKISPSPKMRPERRTAAESARAGCSIQPKHVITRTLREAQGRAMTGVYFFEGKQPCPIRLD